MATLQQSGELTSLSLSKINSFTDRDSKKLIDAIGAVVGKNLSASSTVESISHEIGLTAVIKNITSKISLERLEKPGNTLSYKDEPKELMMFSYEQLKKSSKLSGGVYRGKLYGTIESFSCPINVDCPDCDGSGICSSCKGDKQITCTVCGGDLSCVSCQGTGAYTCTNCDGSGRCPECDDGWISCDECSGDGKVECPDCDGSGVYRTRCHFCDGTGQYRKGKRHVMCRSCKGSGTYTAKCNRCRGEGYAKCDNCSGRGGWECRYCHGSGDCSHCHGEGEFVCKACGGSGTCGKCRGRGKIWCPECHGKGKCFTCKGDKLVTCPRCNGSGEFQSYTQYSMAEETHVRYLSTLPIAEKSISAVNGDVCFNGLVYDFFAKRADTCRLEEVVKSVPEDYASTISTWLSLDANSTFTSNELTDDYLYTTAEVYEIPITRVVLKCNSKQYQVWITGHNRMIFYDHLPSWGARLWARIRRFFL